MKNGALAQLNDGQWVPQPSVHPATLHGVTVTPEEKRWLWEQGGVLRKPGLAWQPQEHPGNRYLVRGRILPEGELWSGGEDGLYREEKWGSGFMCQRFMGLD